MESTIAERLQSYFSDSHISMAQVSRDTGIQYDTLQQILYGRVKAMGVDKFAAIWQSYPDLDAWHILTGEPIRSEQQATALTTVAALREFQTQMNEFVDGKIKAIGG